MAPMFSLPRARSLLVLAALLLGEDIWRLPAADFAAAGPAPVKTNALVTNIVSSATPSASTNRPNSVATNTLDDKFRLGIGDRLSYRIVEDLEEAKPLVVTDSGDVEVPLIGRV